MTERSVLDRLVEPPATPPAKAKRGIIGGIVAAAMVIVAKAKAFGLLALKFGTTAWTMLLAAWVYSVQLGWPFAALLVGLILVHELGHGIAARRVGIRVGVPVFVPFVGAFIALRDRPADRWVDFVIAAGGPLCGGVASLGCLVASTLVDGDAHLLLLGCGYFALLLNLFNLLPIWIFDGSKMLPVVRANHAIVGLAALIAVLVATAIAGRVNAMAWLVAAVVAWRIIASRRRASAPTTLLERLQPAPAGPVERSADVVPARRRALAAWTYFGMAIAYAAILQLLAHTAR